MTTNIMDLIKTDCPQRLQDKLSLPGMPFMAGNQERINTKYTSKEPSDGFMKIFENANKSYNFNNNKMKNYSEPQNKQNEQNSDYNYGNTTGNLYNKSFLKPENNNSYEKKYLNSEKTYTNINKPADTKEIHKDSTSHISEKNTVKQKNDDNKTESKENSHKSEKNVDENEKPVTKQTQETTENNKIKSKEPEKQGQKPAKENKGKILAEKAKNNEKELEIKGKKHIPEKNLKIDDKKNVKISQDNSEKETDNLKKKTVNTENKELKKPQQDVQKPEHEKQKTENEKAEILNKLNIKEKPAKEKQETPEISGKKADKPEKSQHKKDIKTVLVPHTKDIKKIHAKDDLNIKNIKVATNAETQKIVKDLRNMNKQGQQNFQQDVKANANHTGAAEGGSQKIDLQKTAQFDKILNSKQAESTEKSVLNQVKNASAQLKANKSQVSITLKPENLGKLNIQLVSHKGTVTAQITAENTHVKDMLAKGTEALRQHLVNQGINVNKITVNVQQDSSSRNDAEFSQADQGNFSGTNPESNNHGEQGQDNLNQAGMESYDFEEDEKEETPKTSVRNLIGNVDYKV